LHIVLSSLSKYACPARLARAISFARFHGFSAKELPNIQKTCDLTQQLFAKFVRKCKKWLTWHQGLFLNCTCDGYREKKKQAFFLLFFNKGHMNTAV
jgi:hypothetical protein